jgi:cyclophilin family peptidyl-prolyl cis-trans isomerase
VLDQFHRPRRLAAPALALLAGATLAACGGGGGGTAAIPSGSASATPTTTATTAAPGTATPSGAAADLKACTTVSGEANVPCPTQLLAPGHTYTVKLQTSSGEIDIRLANTQAPATAATFAYLVRRGFYNGLSFHRIVAQFVIQGGDPSGTGLGGPGFQVVEAPPSSLQYNAGIVAMAKTQNDPPGAAGSQFFICTGTTNLPPQYAYIGDVTKGLAVAQRISLLPNSGPPQNTPDHKVLIRRATLVTS